MGEPSCAPFTSTNVSSVRPTYPQPRTQPLDLKEKGVSVDGPWSMGLYLFENSIPRYLTMSLSTLSLDTSRKYETDLVLHVITKDVQLVNESRIRVTPVTRVIGMVY